MFKHQIKGFVAGVIITCMMFSITFAAPVTKSIKVILDSINIQVNGKAVKSDTIVYNNNLYAPVKTVAESLGKEFKWDTKTNAVTIKDKVAPTPANTNSRTNPAGIGQKFTVKTSDFLTGNYEYEITMTDLMSGDKAWQTITAANQFNFEPKAGKEYILAKFKVKLLNISEGKTFDINNSCFDIVSSKGVLYSDFISIAGLDPDLNTELYKGAEFEGWTYFMVDKTDSPVCVINRGQSGEVWFNLRTK